MDFTVLWSILLLNVLILHKTGAAGSAPSVGHFEHEIPIRTGENIEVTSIILSMPPGSGEPLRIIVNEDFFDIRNSTVDAINETERPMSVRSSLLLNLTSSTLEVEMNNSVLKTDDYAATPEIKDLEINATSTDGGVSRRVSEFGIGRQVIERSSFLSNTNNSDKETGLQDTNTSANASISMFSNGTINGSLLDYKNKVEGSTFSNVETTSEDGEFKSTVSSVSKLLTDSQKIESEINTKSNKNKEILPIDLKTEQPSINISMSTGTLNLFGTVVEESRIAPSKASENFSNITKNKEIFKNRTMDLHSKFRAEIIDKDRSFLNCSKEKLRETEYVILANDTLYAPKYRLTLNSSYYFLSGNSAIVCKIFVNRTGILGRFPESSVVILECFIVSLGSLFWAWLYFCSYTTFSLTFALTLVLTFVTTGIMSVMSWKSHLISNILCIQYFNITALLTISWIVLLSCKSVLKYLKEYGYLTVSNGQIRIKLEHFFDISCIIALAVTAVTFLADVIFSFEKSATYEIDGTQVRNPTVTLSPAVCFVLTFVIMIASVERPQKTELNVLEFHHINHFYILFELMFLLLGSFLSGVIAAVLQLYEVLQLHGMMTMYLLIAYREYLVLKQWCRLRGCSGTQASTERNHVGAEHPHKFPTFDMLLILNPQAFCEVGASELRNSVRLPRRKRRRRSRRLLVSSSTRRRLSPGLLLEPYHSAKIPRLDN